MKATESYLLKLLSNNDVTFYIPPYQRNYEWNTVQCKVFLNDIVKTTQKNVAEEIAEHFFGSIVFTERRRGFGQPARLILTDGQQRITTTMLFLIALRDLMSDEKHQEIINSQYLKNSNVIEDNEYKIKLKQVETDWEAYRNIILGHELTSDNEESEIFKNYSYFKKELLKIEKEIPLISLLENGLSKFSIVIIELEPDKNSWENPQEIFESMNSLGKPLSLADLVRNYLLLGKPSDVQEVLYRDYWLTLEKTLPQDVSNFIRDFMQMYAETDYKKATENNYKELYGEFKELFGGITTENILSDFKKFASYYSFILRGKGSGSRTIDERLSDLRFLGASTSYSLLLKLIEYWKLEQISEGDFIKILDVLITYILRRRIIKLTSVENKMFPALIKEINQLISASDKKMTMFKLLASREHAARLPNDIEVRAELTSMNFYNFKLARFILSLVEEKITKSRPNYEDRHLQLEHIMPQTMNDSWREEIGVDAEDVHAELINSIGNLTLIRHNQELGNKCFTDKKNIYSQSEGLQIAREHIINRTKWNKISINSRSKWLINYILDRVIPIPDIMKNMGNYSQKRNNRLSFSELGLIGYEINYISDKEIRAIVVNDKEVEFEGKIWKLSPLTKEIETRKNRLTLSGAYRGAQYWEYENMKLSDII